MSGGLCTRRLGVGRVDSGGEVFFTCFPERPGVEASQQRQQDQRGGQDCVDDAVGYGIGQCVDGGCGRQGSGRDVDEGIQDGGGDGELGFGGVVAP